MQPGRRRTALLRGLGLRRAGLLLALGVLVAASPLAVLGSAAALQRTVASASNSEGYWSSVSQAGGPNSYTYGLSVAMTSTGTSIVTGRFNRTTYFPTSADDSIALTSLGGDEAYVAAWDSASNYFLWAQRAGGSGHDAAFSVALTRDDTPIVTGRFLGTAYFPTSADDSIALTSQFNNDTLQFSEDVFVAALNEDDSYFAWAQLAGGERNDFGWSVAVIGDDTPIVTGGFSGTAYFPTSADDSIALSSLGSNDVFVAALNSDDSYFAWVQRAGGSAFDYGASVATTRDDTPIVTGYFAGTAYFPTAADDSIALTSLGSNDVFIAALNSDDSYFSWVQRVGGSGTDEANSIAFTGDDTPVVTGFFEGTAYFPTSADDSIALTSSSTNQDLFVGALNADDSYFAWVQRAGGASWHWAEGWSVAVTRDDTIPIMTGRFGGTVYFPTSGDDSIALTSSSEDVFVAALNADDTYFAWAQLAGGTGFDFGASVALTADDTPIITGYFSGQAYFPSSADDSISRTASGWNDLFVGVFGGVGAPSPGPGPSPGPTPNPGPVPAPVLPPSAPRDVEGVAGDASAVLSWSPPASAGSFPVTNYQAVLTPGEHSCLVAAPTLTCSVGGLSNGTAYVATVRALNGAAWGAASTASEPFTPVRAASPSIVIAGSRDDVDPRVVTVTGATTGLVGERVTPWIRFLGQRAYTAGLRSPLVGSDGTFDWSRRAGRTISVHFTHGDVKSNPVVIKKR